jgi:hypothetical protein
LAAFSFLPILPGFANNKIDEKYFEKQDEVELRLKAISAAYAKARLMNLESRDKILVVRKSGRFFVVSFVNSKPTLGGGSHYVFDPLKMDVVRVEFDE